MKIPLTKPYWGKREERAALHALRSSPGVGDGPFSKALARKLASYTGARFAYPVTSCTHGLELVMGALGIGPGDEVIIPSFTMSSTANCILREGGAPVFADIDRQYYNIDPHDIESLINKHTRGIIVVHYAGMSCPMDIITAIARKYKLFVVEDAAHALGATFKGKPLGTLSHAGVYSFHGSKNISCGEGGAVVTNNSDLAQKMEIIRANGTNRNAFLAGVVEKYSWIMKGSSYFLSDILASIAHEQLLQIDNINKKRYHIASYYTETLSPYKSIIQLPSIPAHASPNWHIYAIRFSKVTHQKYFIREMRKEGVEVSSHYVPLHSSTMGRRLGGKKRRLRITDTVSQTLVRLPIYPGLTARETTFIMTTAAKILESL